jgi:ribosomal protein S18 acetylase RimI-like enzyme
MSTPILIRWLLPSDAAAVRRLAHRGPSRPPRWTCKDLRGFLACGLNHGLVAEVKDRPVGFLLYRISIHDATLVLHQLMVAPRWRRRGVGSRLLDAMGALLRAVPWARLTILIHERNLPAQLFLRSTGFRVRTIHRGYFADGEAAYLFERRQRQDAP